MAGKLRLIDKRTGADVFPGTGMLFSTIMGIMFFFETTNSIQFIGIFFIIIGVILMGPI